LPPPRPQHGDVAADDGEQDRLGEELRPDLGLCRTEGAREADLRAVFQHRDDHDVGDAENCSTITSPNSSQRSSTAYEATAVLDFETASSRGTPCQVAAIRIHDGQEVDVFTTLIFRPPDLFDSFNIALHGIERDVRNAPRWPDVKDELCRFIAGSPCVRITHHSIWV